MNLTKEQIKRFIEYYGNDDVFYDCKTNSQGYIEVSYFQHMKKFISDESIPMYFEEIERKPQLRENLSYLIISNKGVQVLDSKDKTLEKNYEWFLSDLKKESQNEPDNTL